MENAFVEVICVTCGDSGGSPEIESVEEDDDDDEEEALSFSIGS